MMRKTKIICTIGPASREPAVLEKLIRSGMDVARLNFSHGTRDEHQQTLADIRSISKRLGKPIAVLQDLPGPKLRIGPIAGGEVQLKQGEPFTLTSEPVEGTAQRVSVNYPLMIRDVKIGDTLLLADGSIQLEVIAKGSDKIECRVLSGGTLASHKGINLPGESSSIPAFTSQDEEDLLWGIEQGVDFAALSFIRTAEDLYRAKRLLEQHRSSVHLIAKIEKRGAVENFDQIIEIADAIMIARGDLGVEIPLEKVPTIQKQLIRKANLAAKPIITATQMLKSMVDAPRPTRAEAADVANAVLDGSDALMLSEETAVGKYPVDTVNIMSNIIQEAEKSFPFWRNLDRKTDCGPLTIEEAVSQASNDLAYYLRARAIITPTESGQTARLVARYRPKVPILAFSRHGSTQRILQLSWGVYPFLLPDFSDLDDMIGQAKRIAASSGWVFPGDTVVFTAGLPLKEAGGTNLIRADRIS
ncbi:MAG: pyruvate kinase [bacterium]|nr:pyruvate kinase [bacterium]